MSIFHRQQSGRKQASPAAMRGIIIFTSAFLAVSGVACSSSQENVKGGGSMVGSKLIEREDPPKGQAAQKDSLKNVVPSRTDTLILSPTARKLVEERIQQLKEEEKEIKMPGVDKDAPKETDSNIYFAFREISFISSENDLYKCALDGDGKEVEKARNFLFQVGERFHQIERAQNIIQQFEKIIHTK